MGRMGRTSTINGPPSNITAPEALRPVDVPNRLVSPLPRLGHRGAARRDAQNPSAVGNDMAVFGPRSGVEDGNVF